MSYQVLARKWRPRDFASLIGQEHVVKALVNALEQQRLHHAYLFTGTRGVGKTTIARIIAKTLNCEAGISAEPCGKCSACVEIDEGRFVDLLEVDAASRTKVEDTRELLENVQYAPTRARFKIYLVDEVHMLSQHSFNALLKTLEEPPPHVKFLLATTDPQKLPVTVLSRCLQFNLRNVPAAAIAAHLATIVEAEGLAADEAALQRIARAAAGSIRDALSLLDQAIAFGGGEVRSAGVVQMLGDVPREQVYELLECLAEGDAAALLERVARLAESVSDFSAVLDDLAAVLQRLAVAMAVPGRSSGNEDEDGERLAALAARLSPEDVQLYYQIALLGKRDLPLAPDPLSGFEMVLLRMHAFRPAESGTPVPAPPSPGSRETGKAAAPAARSTSPARAAPPRAHSKAPRDAAVEAETPAPARGDTSPAAPFEGDWPALVERLPLQGLPHELAANCELLEHGAERLRLRLGESHANLLSEGRRARLEQAVRSATGETWQLRIDVGETEGETPAARRSRLEDERYLKAREAIDGDPLVQSIKDSFGAEVDAESVRPLGGPEQG